MNRIEIIDGLRGLCIVLMVAFHFGYDLVAYAGAPVGLIYNPLLNFLQPFFAGVFIFLSGVSCRFSKNNFRRGLEMLAAGGVVTLVTWLMGNPAWFGILSFLGAAALFFSGFDWLHKQYLLRRYAQKHALGAATIGIIGSSDGPTVAVYDDGTRMIIDGMRNLHPHRRNVKRVLLIAVCAVLFAVYYAFFYRRAYDVHGLFWLGFRSVGFQSSDYFPVLPWIFIYLAGACCGLWVVERRLPERFYTLRVPFFAAVGRNTMLVYLCHQPLLYGLAMAIAAVM